ncbi:nucleotide sugar dehydrogenase [Cohnella sp. GCM10027633]|uniref:nucleotide sugar dehydrogenase n=1 Tax=unclassified Cohnella TaxID=2636738 RepID=UPI003642E100
MKICVIGLGYIGLPTAAMFANHGNEVIGVDINKNIVDALNKGEISIEEPGLQGFVKSAVEKNKLSASTEIVPADVFIIAVPTPITADHKADLSYVVSATKAIVPYLRKDNILIVESTIPPRTVQDVVCPILIEAGFPPGEDLYVSHCPERVLPGQILIELVHNNRIVGGINSISAQKAKEVYECFVKGEIYLTDATSAEMAKLMENTFRDVNIALANELAMICERLGMNALEVIRMANKHPRVNIHQPGPGVGGHCLAVDPYFIIEKAPEESKIIALSRQVNSHMPHFVVDQIHKLSGMKPRKVAVLGVTYKGNIDDYRESPATEVIDLLIEQGIAVSIFDPHVKHYTQPLAKDLETALTGADFAVVLADHNEFKQLDFDRYASLMNAAILLDTKNCVKSGRKMKVYTIGDYMNRGVTYETVI